MTKTLSAIGLAMTLLALPFAALAHEEGTPHQHPGAIASSTKPLKPAPRPEVKKAIEVKKEIEQKRLVASTTDARPTNLKPKPLFKEASTTRPAFHEEMQQKREGAKADLEAKREQMQSALEAKRAKFEEEGKKRMEALKKKFGEERGARIEEYFKKMIEKFEAAIERQQAFADKIAAFVDKAEDAGKDVSALRAALATANDALIEAASALEDAKAKYAEAAANTDFTARFAAVRTLVEGVAEKVKTSHRALTDVLNALKGLGGGRGDSATTTSTTAP